MSDSQETFISHLIELRKRLFRSALVIAIGTIISSVYVDQIFKWVIAPIQKYLAKVNGELVFTGVIDKFSAYFKVALLAGLIISAPFWLYQVWKFIEPALYKHERKLGLTFIFSGSILFLVGVAFVYFFVFDFTFDYLLNIGDGDMVKPMINLEEYLSFFLLMCIAFGLSFELPLVLALLAYFGLVDASMLRKYRRYAIVIMAVVAAIITPPDPASMLFTLGPLIVLYETSVFIVARIARGAANGTSVGTPS